MKKLLFVKFLGLTLSGLLLVACGQTGALYSPSESDEAEARDRATPEAIQRIPPAAIIVP